MAVKACLWTVIWLTLVGTAGCVFSAPQYDAARASLAALFPGDLLQYPYDPQGAWVYQLNGLEAIVFPDGGASGVRFVSSAGARLRFAGFGLESGSGLPNGVRSFKVLEGPGGARVHDVEGVGRFEMLCSPAIVSESNTILTSCEYRWPETGKTYDVQHRVVLDAAGLARRIEFELVPNAGPFVLERLIDRVDAQTMATLRSRFLESQ